MNKYFFYLAMFFLLTGCQTANFNTKKDHTPKIFVVNNDRNFIIDSNYKYKLNSYLEKTLYYNQDQTKVSIHSNDKKTALELKHYLLTKGFKGSNIKLYKLGKHNSVQYFTIYKESVLRQTCKPYTMDLSIDPGCYAAQNRWVSFNTPLKAILGY